MPLDRSSRFQISGSDVAAADRGEERDGRVPTGASGRAKIRG
jgi:hypothetical protein